MLIRGCGLLVCFRRGFPIICFKPKGQNPGRYVVYVGWLPTVTDGQCSDKVKRHFFPSLTHWLTLASLALDITSSGFCSMLSYAFIGPSDLEALVSCQLFHNFHDTLGFQIFFKTRLFVKVHYSIYESNSHNFEGKNFYE